MDQDQKFLQLRIYWQNLREMIFLLQVLDHILSLHVQELLLNSQEYLWVFLYFLYIPQNTHQMFLFFFFLEGAAFLVGAFFFLYFFFISIHCFTFSLSLSSLLISLINFSFSLNSL